MSDTPTIERHIISVLVDNEPGVLARVIGLFSGRGYNIESLTVAETDEGRALSRISIVTTGTPMVIEQIKAQLARLVPIHSVRDLTENDVTIERELALVKIINSFLKKNVIGIADTIILGRYVEKLVYVGPHSGHTGKCFRIIPRILVLA